MSTVSFVFLCVGVLDVNVGALSDEDRTAIYTKTLPLVVECSKEHNVQEEEIKTAKDKLSTIGLNPCFLDCFLKKAGILNSAGLFDLDATREKTKPFVKDEKDLSKFETIGKICLAVNDEPASKKCETAKLLVDCFIKNKGDFSPFTS